MKKSIVLLIVLLAFSFADPASAQDNTFKIYGALNWVSPTGDENVEVDDLRDKVEASDEIGWSLGFEWRANNWVGIEVDYLNADHDLEFGGSKIAETTLSPLSGSFNFHLVHTRFIDLYFGPTVSWVNWDDIEETGGTSVETDDEFAYGAQIGLDVSLFKTIALVTGLRYLKLDIAAKDGGEEISVDPLFAKIGVAFRW